MEDTPLGEVSMGKLLILLLHEWVQVQPNFFTSFVGKVLGS
jgi:hypothetical protein